MKLSSKEIVKGALVGALYALLTLAVAPISSGLLQLRVSEALCVLPYFIPAAVPGLFVGCIVANLLVGASVYDIVFGSIATLIAAWLTRLVRKHELPELLAPLPPVVLNAVIVGALLAYVYDVGTPFYACALYVGAGELIVCYVLGVPLMKACAKWPQILGDKKREV